MSETINLGWLKDYTGTKFLPKTITTQLLNTKGTNVFISENIGSKTKPIYLNNGVFSACDILPLSSGGTGATTAAQALKNLEITATASEINYISGVTSNIQNQLNDKISKSSTGIQSIAGGLVIGGSSSQISGQGRIMVTGANNPYIGVQATDASGNLLTPYYLQVVNDAIYLGPTYTKALSFDKNGKIKMPSSLTMNGHLYLAGAKETSSTSNTTQIVFGTEANNHVAISSNTNAIVINPSTTQTTNQIVLYLDKASKFPSGIDGNASSATKLATARTVQVDLASTSSASFNGTANITPGVTGILPMANGGLGSDTSGFKANSLLRVSSSGGKTSELAPPSEDAVLQYRAESGGYYTWDKVPLRLGGLDTDLDNRTNWPLGAIPYKYVGTIDNYDEIRSIIPQIGILGVVDTIPKYLNSAEARSLAGISSGISLPDTANEGDIFLLYDT